MKELPRISIVVTTESFWQSVRKDIATVFMLTAPIVMLNDLLKTIRSPDAPAPDLH